MTAGQPLRGLVGQGMNGRRPKFNGAAEQFPPGSHTFRATKAGSWKFVLWGGGGGGPNALSAQAAGSGAYLEVTRRLAVGQAVALSVGTGGAAVDGGDTSVTFTATDSATAGGGKIAGTGGAVSGSYDYGLAGSPGGNGAAGTAGQGTGGGAAGTGAASFGGGAGAPARLPFHGGTGGPGINGATRATAPGAGGGVSANNTNVVSYGGDGAVIAYYVRS